MDNIMSYIACFLLGFAACAAWFANEWGQISREWGKVRDESNKAREVLKDLMQQRQKGL